MAEPIKGRKLTLREILDEIAEDEGLSEAEREKANEQAFETEYQEWKMQQIKAGR